jgi:hypothetical protein
MYPLPVIFVIVGWGGHAGYFTPHAYASIEECKDAIVEMYQVDANGQPDPNVKIDPERFKQCIAYVPNRASVKERAVEIMANCREAIKHPHEYDKGLTLADCRKLSRAEAKPPTQ